MRDGLNRFIEIKVYLLIWDLKGMDYAIKEEREY